MKRRSRVSHSFPFPHFTTKFFIKLFRRSIFLSWRTQLFYNLNTYVAIYFHAVSKRWQTIGIYGNLCPRFPRVIYITSKTNYRELACGCAFVDLGVDISTSRARLRELARCDVSELPPTFMLFNKILEGFLLCTISCFPR